MSYTELYAAMEDGDMQSYATFKNSHGGAMMIWRALIDKYLPVGPGEFMFEKIKQLWETDVIDRMDEIESMVLLTTYDRVAVERADMPLLVERLRAFKKRFLVLERGHPKFVCSLGEQATAIAKAYDEGAIAVAWNQTSVNESHWEVWVPEGEDEGETRPFNVKKDTDFSYLGAKEV